MKYNLNFMLYEIEFWYYCCWFGFRFVKERLLGVGMVLEFLIEF